MESNLSSLNFSILDIYLVSNQDDRDFFADSSEILMPFRYISVSDSTTDIKHDNSALSSDVISFSKSSKFFLTSSIPNIEFNGTMVSKESDDIEEEFDNFMNKEKVIAFNKLCQEENLDTNKMQNILDEYVFSGKLINMNDKVDKSLNVREPLFKRQVTIERVIDKVQSLISKFFEDIAA